MAAITKDFKVGAYLCRQDGDQLVDVNAPHKEPERRDEWPSVVNPDTLMPVGVLDVFPFKLTAPIVCVERPNNDEAFLATNIEELAKRIVNPSTAPKCDGNIEAAIEKRAEEYDGMFAGT